MSSIFSALFGEKIIAGHYARFTTSILSSAPLVAMEPIDFNLVVLPLAILIGLLVIVVLLIATRKEHADQRLENIKMQLRLGEIDKKTFEQKLKRLESNKMFHEELDELRALHDENKIDLDTYLRLWQILVHSKMKEAGYVHISTEPDGATMHFRKPHNGTNLK